MIAKTISLTYDGYWREPNVGGIPAQSGVYSVYACRHNVSAGTVTIRKLIYIGESRDVRARIQGHEKWRTWRQHLNPGEELCFNFAPIVTDRERAEAALIHHHKPPVNTEYVNEFPYPQTTIRTGGRSTLLDGYFTVYTTARRSLYRTY